MDDYARFVLDRAKAGVSPPQKPAEFAEIGLAAGRYDAAAAARLAAKKAAKKRRRRGL
jgi:hypothetical protein